MHAPKKSSKNPTITLLIGSLTEIHGDGCVILSAKTGEKVRDI